MSSDIYIPLSIALSHPGQFQYKTALNGCVEDARKMLDEQDCFKIDWWAVEDEMKPVLLCKFGARDTWRAVEVFDHDLHVCCAGDFRTWLIQWLNDHNYNYQIH
jgi:hypothetical protein